MTETPGRDRPATSAAHAFLQQLREHALVGEAQEVAHGIRHLSIAYGQPETDDEMFAEILNPGWWRVTQSAQPF